MSRILLALLAGLALSLAATGCDSGDPEDDVMLERRPVRDTPKSPPSVPSVNVTGTETEEGAGTPD